MFQELQVYWTAPNSNTFKDGYEVLAISRSQKRAGSFPWFKDVKFISYDFHGDLQSAETEVEGFRGLIHLAWQDLPNYDSSIHVKKIYQQL